MDKLDKENSPSGRFDIKSFYPIFCTAAFILILMKFPFYDFESVFYDLWSKMSIKSKPGIEYVLVSMDETDDQILGDFYPYTYRTHSKFVENLLSDRPKGLVYLHTFAEPSQESDEENFNKFYEEVAEYKNTGGTFIIGTSMDYLGEQIPPEKLQRLGFAPALINIDGEDFAKDGVHRKIILNISGEESLHSLVASEIKKDFNSSDIWGAFYKESADAQFSYYRYKINLDSIDSHVETIPFYKIVNGDFPPNYFKDKFIILGPSYLSNSDDFVYTALNSKKLYPKIHVHAAMIDSLVRNATVSLIPDYVSGILTLILAIFLSVLVSRVKPSAGLLFTVGMMICVVLLSYLLFVIFGLWLKLAHMILSIFIVNYIWFPFRAISEYQTRYAIEEETTLLKKVENLKQNFISLMSHDLKTPVAKIAGIADNLKVRVTEETPVRMVNEIIDSTKELNQFITSILDLTKIESRNLSLNMSSKDVNKIIEDVVSKLTYEAKRDNVTVDLQLEPLYPIELDPTLIHRVISNIVENAIKYSEDGDKVEIKSHDDEKWVYIQIKDNGPGIGKDDLEHIFDKFYRVKNDSSHKIKGSGLGLYLVKYFVELHEGEIEVESEKNQGTQFTVKLLNK